MRIALVSPYSWTYQGGVNKHVEALAEEFLERGHEARVLAPWDPPDRLTRRLHRGPAVDRAKPDYLVPLGRTVGFGANGAVSNLSVFPDGVVRMRRELQDGDYDVVHVHEPPAPTLAWDACSFRGAPVIGTFHAYAPKALPNQIASLIGARRKFNQLTSRIAVSEAAAWTGKRWFGGDYRVIPNGVDISGAPAPTNAGSDEFRIVFLGRAEERKGLPVLLTAFSALVEHENARLVVIGASKDEVAKMLHDPEVGKHIDVLGKVSDEELWRQLAEADVLCAPSLSGESFGMVLIEAFAAGTPVIASQIAGYSDVVSDGFDGILVPPADPQRLAEELQRLMHEPERRAAMGAAARENAKRFAWAHVADEVEEVYELAQEVPAPATRTEKIARTSGLVRADGGPRRPARRLPSPEPDLPGSGSRGATARKIGLGIAAGLGLALTVMAFRKIGVQNVAETIVRSDFTWVLVATALMVSSLFMRAAAWYSIARAALPGRVLRRRDVTSATMIGVLMSATLPARLGEPARAMVLARRTGRMRETFPVLLGTLVSQTVINLFALVLLGVIIVSSTDLFHHSTQRIFLFSLAPLLLLIALVLAPFVIRTTGGGRLSRLAASARKALIEVRTGLRVFRNPRLGSVAVLTQLGAWALQLLSCWALLQALGLTDGTGIAAAAAVLFAVNVTAVVPATPSNIGIFQLAVISVLHTGFGVSAENALAYGVILQAVEIATAVGLGLPALVREGVSWSDMRLRALQAAPVRLEPRPRSRNKVREPVA